MHYREVLLLFTSQNLAAVRKVLLGYLSSTKKKLLYLTAGSDSKSHLNRDAQKRN